jgi:hypothetical protein
MRYFLAIFASAAIAFAGQSSADLITLNLNGTITSSVDSSNFFGYGIGNNTVVGQTLIISDTYDTVALSSSMSPNGSFSASIGSYTQTGQNYPVTTIISYVPGNSIVFQQSYYDVSYNYFAGTETPSLIMSGDNDIFLYTTFSGSIDSILNLNTFLSTYASTITGGNIRTDLNYNFVPLGRQMTNEAFATLEIAPSSVPLPSAIEMFASGLLGIGALRKNWLKRNITKPTPSMYARCLHLRPLK